MEIDRIIDALLRPAAYPHEAEDLELRQTHISAVFLAGRFAYKVKKPIDLGFLDFTTLERRLRFCHEEVRLNRRLAPDVYLGVVPLLETNGGLRMGPVLQPPESRDEPGAEVTPAGEGPPGVSGGADRPDAPVESGHVPVEYAVKMKRLPDEATFLALLERDELEASHLEELARRMARFHAEADAGPYVDRFGRFAVVAGNARENLEQARPCVGTTISARVHARLTESLERRLEALRPLIESRAEAGVPRDTHGDLHLQHVYRLPERPPPADLTVIDCIEFNQRFRYADPVADIAFLTMDLRYHGRPELGERFAEAYFEASEDEEGVRLLPFYVSYRAAVRGKVRGFASEDRGISDSERWAAVEQARAYWLLALSRLVGPDRRPGLVLVGGLPGTGKTTVAEGLARRANLRILSSDRVRKSLAGLEPEESAAAEFGKGIYTKEWNERTYRALLEQAEAALFEGERVVVDASFREDRRRLDFLRAGRRLRVPSLYLQCEARPEVVRARLDERAGGVSDANWAIYEGAVEVWEEASEETAAGLVNVDTNGAVADTLDNAVAALREAGLLSTRPADS